MQPHLISILGLSCIPQNTLIPQVNFIFDDLAILAIFLRMTTPFCLLFFRICFSVSKYGLAYEIFRTNKHSKLAPSGPANFCANPAVIHVGLRTQV